MSHCTSLRIYLAAGFVLLSGLLGKAESGCLPVTINNPDGNYLIPGVWGEIPYRVHNGVPLALDAYVQQGVGNRPGVIVVHGGNWTSGSRVAFVGQLLSQLTRSGFNWFSIDYRKGPEHPWPQAVDDLRSAFSFVRCNADRFRIDAERMAVIGEDSGGHLAAQFAAEKPPGLQAVVAFGSPFDLDSWSAAHENPTLRSYFGLHSQDNGLQLREASPFYAVKAGMPAVLAIHGIRDRVVPLEQSIRYCSAIRRRAGQCEVLPVEGAIHRPENWTPSQWGYKAKMVQWLRRRLAAGPLPHQPYPSERLHKDLPYQIVADAPPAWSVLRLDAYTPPGQGPFPAVILVHGGGWEAGDKVTYLTPLLEPLSRAGFAWFSIDYRLTPRFRHEDQLQDLARAIRWVRHHAERFQVNPSRIAVLGESASGQMALLLGARECLGNPTASDPVDRESCRVQALVSLYGVYDLNALSTEASPGSIPARLFGIRALDESAREVLKRYSPLFQVAPPMPPLLLVHGTDEILWEQAVRMRQRAGELKLDVDLIELKGAPHGMENWEGHPQWEHYKASLIQWLKRKL